MSTDPQPTKKWKKLKSTLSWSAAGRDSLHSTIAAVTDSGNALMFSRTLDGTALALSIYSGDTKSKEYVTEPGDIPALLAWVMETYS